MEEEVNSTWSNTDVGHLEEPYIKPLPLAFQKKSMQCRSLATSSRATRKRTTQGNRHPNSRRSTCQYPVSTNYHFLCRYYCGSKRKTCTYSGENDIRPFAQRKVFSYMFHSTLMESTQSKEYPPHLPLQTYVGAVGVYP